MRIVFAGTPEFASTILRSLLDHRHQVVGVFTQPDRPAGRGRRARASPVKKIAQSHRIALRQPGSLRDDSVPATLGELTPDVVVVAAYGLIVPGPLLRIPRLGFINVHASRLPRWRGAAPIQRAILSGDDQSGVTIMQMDEGLDTGEMLLRISTPIAPRETAGTLHDRLAHLGARALLQSLERLESSGLTTQAQQESEATYASRLDKREACINWGDGSEAIDRQVRAFDPTPVAYTTVPGRAADGAATSKRLRVWSTQIGPPPDLPSGLPPSLLRTLPIGPTATGSGRRPGTVIACEGDAFVVATGDGELQLLEVQSAGGRRMRAAEYLNARPVACGTVLGS